MNLHAVRVSTSTGHAILFSRRGRPLGAWDTCRSRPSFRARSARRGTEVLPDLRGQRTPSTHPVLPSLARKECSLKVGSFMLSTDSGIDYACQCNCDDSGRLGDRAELKGVNTILGLQIRYRERTRVQGNDIEDKVCAVPSPMHSRLREAFAKRQMLPVTARGRRSRRQGTVGNVFTSSTTLPLRRRDPLAPKGSRT